MLRILSLCTKSLEILWTLILCFYYTLLSILRYFLPKTFYKSVKNELILITGGGFGLGRLLALELSKLGAIIISLDIDTLANVETIRLIKEEGGEGRAYTCNVVDRKAVYRLAKVIIEEMGVVSMLINNAGIISGKSLLDLSDEQIEATFNVNVIAHFWLLRAFLPGMISMKKGHVVSIASVAGIVGVNQMTDYCSSKYAVIGLNDALKAEIYAEGRSDYIKTTVVCPYFINTGMFDGVNPRCISMLDAHTTVKEIVNGILSSADVVFIPKWMNSLEFLKAFTPMVGRLRLLAALDFSNVMKSFQGREKKN